eukprot:10027-Heterococcus_DN1.PRE.4
MRLSFRRPRKKDGHEPEIDAAAVHELEDVLAEKETAIAALQSRIKQLNGEVQTQLSALKRAHPLEPIIHMVDENGTRAANMGRHASLATTTALNALPAVRKKDELAQKSDKFAKDVQRLSSLNSCIANLYTSTQLVVLQDSAAPLGSVLATSSRKASKLAAYSTCMLLSSTATAAQGSSASSTLTCHRCCYNAVLTYVHHQYDRHRQSGRFELLCRQHMEARHELDCWQCKQSASYSSCFTAAADSRVLAFTSLIADLSYHVCICALSTVADCATYCQYRLRTQASCSC